MGSHAAASERRSAIVDTPEFDEDLLTRFYRTVLDPSFSDPERMTLDEILSAYLGRDPQPGLLLIADGNPVAGLLGEFYEASRVLLIAYLAVLPSQRGQGSGTALMREGLAKWMGALSPSLVLAEIQDPRYHSADAGSGDPEARLRFYERFGARLLALKYFQPSLRSGSPRVNDLFLICFGKADRTVDSKIVTRFLDEYFMTCEGEGSLTDPAYRIMRANAAGQDRKIPLWPLDRYPDLASILNAPKPALGEQ